MSTVSPLSEPSALVPECASRSVSVEVPSEDQERIRAARLLLLSFDMLVSAERDRKPRTRFAAIRFLTTYAAKSVLLSNDSTRLPSDVQAILARCGIRVSEAQIHLVGPHTLGYLQPSASEQRIALIAEPRLEALADRLGLERVTRDAEVLVFMQDSRFDVRKTALAATLVRQGAEVLVADRSGGSVADDGWITPGPWSHLLASLAAADRLHHPVTITGLPYAGMLLSALERAEASPEETVLIGLQESPAVVAATRLDIACIELSHAQELDRLV